MAHTSSPGAQQGPHAPGMHVRPVLWHWGLLEAAQCLPAECSQVVLPVPLITPACRPHPLAGVCRLCQHLWSVCCLLQLLSVGSGLATRAAAPAS